MDHNIIFAKFEAGSRKCNVYGAWQYDYGQVLRIQDLGLQAAVEIHFSLDEKGGTSVSRIGTTKDGVTDVQIPDSMLENGDTTQNYCIYAFLYLADQNSGNTEYEIAINVKSRPRPEIPGSPEEPELFREAIAAVNEAADRAEDAGILAKSWATGETGTREGENADNAKYYAKKAEDAAAGIPGAVEVGKIEIDNYVQKKESELKGDTGNVFFAAFKVKNSRLKMYSDPKVDKVCFNRKGSRLKYRIKL